MVKFAKNRNSKRKVLCCKKTYKIWDVNVDNIVISKLVKTKTNFTYLIGYLDKGIRPLVLIMPKMIGCVKTFKVEDKISKLMSFHKDDEKFLEKYKAIWAKTEDVKNIKFNALPIYDDR